MIDVAVYYISDDEIEERAEEFLAEHLPQREIPIPIEEIIEVDLGIEILPIRAFATRYGIVGYLSNDMQTLVVDEDTMRRYPARYRFTLAHELSHLLLHGDYIQQEFPESEMTWKEKLLKRDPKIHSRMEVQANRMAGALLVPRNELAIAWDEVKIYARARGIEVEDLDEFGLSHLAARIGRDFNVSGQTVSIALQRYRISER